MPKLDYSRLIHVKPRPSKGYSKQTTPSGRSKGNGRSGQFIKFNYKGDPKVFNATHPHLQTYRGPVEGDKGKDIEL